jgi:acid phosphatase (class A)
MSLFESFNVEVFKGKKPPGDKSITTFKELNKLKNFAINKKFVEDNDNILDVFKNIFEKHNLEYPKELFEKLHNDAVPVLKGLKNYHNRTRPKELAQSMGMDIERVDLKSAKTKAYPSGHSAQSMLLAKVASYLHPRYKKEFMKAADDISNSRLIARVHYPSDSKLGIEIGESMYNYIKNNKNGILHE